MDEIWIEKAKELYCTCDVNNTGSISKTDLNRLVEYIPLSPTQLEAVFDSLDEDRNGSLSLEEFIGGFGRFLGIANAQEEEVVEEGVFEEKDDDSQFHSVIENMGDVETLTELENVKDLWSQMKRENATMLPGFEALILRVTEEASRTKREYANLENVMKQKSQSHDDEVRRLYEEMENQIKRERQRLLNEEKQREKQIRDELEQKILEKDMQYQEMMRKQEEMKSRLLELGSLHSDTAQEKEQIAKEKEEIEMELDESKQMLEDSNAYIEELRKKQKDDRRQRAKQAMEVSETIAIERETLVRQLDELRQVNKTLLDQRDMAHSCDGSSVADELGDQFDCDDNDSAATVSQRFASGAAAAKKRQPVAKQGSIIGGYVGAGGGDGDNDADHDDDDEVEYDESIVEYVPTGNAAGEAVAVSTGRRRRSRLLKTTSQGTETEADISLCQSPEDGRLSPEGRSAAIDTEKEQVPTMPERLFKVVFVGDSGVGKSSIIFRLCQNSFRSTFSATIGVDFQIKPMYIDGKCVALQVWDTAGQERFRSITKQYFRKADGVVIVYDITSEMSFMNVREWLISVDEGTTKSTVKLLLANKTDLVENDVERQRIPFKDGMQLAEEHGAMYYEVSAKSGDGVFESFEAFTAVLKEKEDLNIMNAIQVSTSAEKSNEQNCCAST